MIIPLSEIMEMNMNKVADRKELTLEVESGSDEKNKPLVTKPSLDNSF